MSGGALLVLDMRLWRSSLTPSVASCYLLIMRDGIQTVKEVEQRVAELAALVPDLTSRLSTMKADILIALLEDTEVYTSDISV